MSKLTLSSGPPLHFDGPYLSYLGYQILIGVSILTIIGLGVGHRVLLPLGGG